jgi:cyclic lactone autoinducer peptide
MKGVIIMNVQNVKKQAAKTLADISLKLGTISADSVCCYIFHQPKMPKELKRMKRGK